MIIGNYHIMFLISSLLKLSVTYSLRGIYMREESAFVLFVRCPEYWRALMAL